MNATQARMRCLIVDDEPLARSSVRKLLSEEPDVDVLAECANGREALAAAKAHSPDLMFVDVQMPGMDGLELVDQLTRQNAGERSPMVIFATAFDKFALKAFDAHAVDYLLKPLEDERFKQAVERARQRRKLEQVADATRKLSEMLDSMRLVLESGPAVAGRPPGGYPDRISIHQSGRVEIVELADVVWIEAADQYVLFHTDKTEHLMREPMAELEKKLDPTRFVRIHRSAMVALPHVRRFERDGSGTGKVLVGKDLWLPVSRSRTALLRDRLG
ncbi:MAG: response regulator transcription factor [Planctomycetes bacterium]|nr:response regulator transcription factor [Planctomycetota bacterium]